MKSGLGNLIQSGSASQSIVVSSRWLAGSVIVTDDQPEDRYVWRLIEELEWLRLQTDNM